MAMPQGIAIADASAIPPLSINTLSAAATSPGAAAALRELSVGLCRGNFLMYRASGGMFARVSGRGFRAGLAVPTDEVIE
jgi:hypothetical protein